MNNAFRQKLKRCLPLWLVKIIRKFTRYSSSPQIVYNIGWTSDSNYRVFFSYVPGILFKNGTDSFIGTKEVESSCFLHALISAGASVDFSDVNNSKGIGTNYDYIFGQGKAFREARRLNPQAKAVLYLTEKTPDFSFEKEKERVEYLYKRHKIKESIHRSGRFFINEDFIGLHACIMLAKKGDNQLLPGINTFILHPSGLINGTFHLTDRDIGESKRNFFWIGSSGAVHKGLDILFDVFSLHPELSLHVCGLLPDDRAKLKKIIPKNVIDHGFVIINSAQFRDIANKCAFIIFPSCSEAVATSVITAMNHGMIPLVSKESSFEDVGIGEILSSFLVKDIEEVVLRWSHKNDSFLLEEMQKTIEWAKSDYSLKNYN